MTAPFLLCSVSLCRNYGESAKRCVTSGQLMDCSRLLVAGTLSHFEQYMALQTAADVLYVTLLLAQGLSRHHSISQRSLSEMHVVFALANCSIPSYAAHISLSS